MRQRQLQRHHFRGKLVSMRACAHGRRMVSPVRKTPSAGERGERSQGLVRWRARDGQADAHNTEAVADAKAVQAAVRQALGVLQKFYDAAAQATSLVQSRAGPANDAPASFSTPYRGMGDSSKGVLGMLDGILPDFVRLDEKEPEIPRSEVSPPKPERRVRGAEHFTIGTPDRTSENDEEDAASSPGSSGSEEEAPAVQRRSEADKLRMSNDWFDGPKAMVPRTIQHEAEKPMPFGLNAVVAAESAAAAVAAHAPQSGGGVARRRACLRGQDGGWVPTLAPPSAGVPEKFEEPHVWTTQECAMLTMNQMFLDGPEWNDAKEVEHQGFLHNKAYSWIKRAAVPEGERIWDTRFMNTIKANGTYKSRIIVRGDLESQHRMRMGLPHVPTDSPTVARGTSNMYWMN